MDELRNSFRNPPVSHRAAPLWVWNDLMSEQQIAFQLKDDLLDFAAPKCFGSLFWRRCFRLCFCQCLRLGFCFRCRSLCLRSFTFRCGALCLRVFAFRCGALGLRVFAFRYRYLALSNFRCGALCFHFCLNSLGFLQNQSLFGRKLCSFCCHLHRFAFGLLALNRDLFRRYFHVFYGCR